MFTVEHAFLAVLELLTHLEFSTIMSDYVLIQAEFDDDLQEEIEEKDLPQDCRTYPAPHSLRGDRVLLRFDAVQE